MGTTLCAKRIAHSRFHPEIGNAKKILIIPSILVWIIGGWNLDIGIWILFVICFLVLGIFHIQGLNHDIGILFDFFKLFEGYNTRVFPHREPRRQ